MSDPMKPAQEPLLAVPAGSATSFLASMMAQKTFDALVALRLERSGQTRESAIAWAKEQLCRMLLPKTTSAEKEAP